MAKYTNRFLELIEDGTVDKDVAIQACLEYMSDADVKDMMLNNDFPIDADVEVDFIDSEDLYDDDSGIDYD